MLKEASLLLSGSVIGAGTTWLVTKSMWEADTAFHVRSYVELNDQYLKMQNSVRSNESKATAQLNSAYRRQDLVTCMFMSNLRNDAIRSHMQRVQLSDLERGAFLPLASVAARLSEKSHHTQSVELGLESIRLDNECLNSAMIKSQ